MKLVRYGAAGREKPGIIDKDGRIRDLSRVVKDINGDMLNGGGLAKIKKAKIDKLPKVGGKPRIGPCVGNIRNFIPAHRFGQPEEFGAACAFLCSAHAGFITGQNLLMDGGAFPGAF